MIWLNYTLTVSSIKEEDIARRGSKFLLVSLTSLRRFPSPRPPMMRPQFDVNSTAADVVNAFREEADGRTSEFAVLHMAVETPVDKLFQL